MINFTRLSLTYVLIAAFTLANAQIVKTNGGSVGTAIQGALEVSSGTSLGTTPAFVIDAVDNNAVNGYGFFVGGNATPSIGNTARHTQISTGNSDSRLTLKCGEETDFAPRLQMISGNDIGLSTQGAAIFDYGSRLFETSNTAFFSTRFMPMTGAPVEMITAKADSSVLLVPTAGVVGIGTTKPSALLHVAGAIRSDDLYGGGIVYATREGDLTIVPETNIDQDYILMYDGANWGVQEAIWKEGTTGNYTSDRYIGIGTYAPNHPLTVRDTNAGTVVYIDAVNPTYSYPAGRALSLEAGSRGIHMTTINPRELDGAVYGIYLSNFIPNQTLLTGTHYGIYGYASGRRTSSFSNYSICGVEGVTNGYGINYAGYFSGDVTVTGTFSNPSDRKLKQNINDIEEALDIIQALRPRTYTHKTEEFPHMMLDDGQQYGFVAQELQTVLPELVNRGNHPENKPEEGEVTDKPLGEQLSYQSVEYLGLIPILTQGIKEQQSIIEDQQKNLETQNQQIQAQEARITRLENLLQNLGLDDETSSTSTASSKQTAQLFQNQPNPFTSMTSIPYFLPLETESAYIRIIEIQSGKTVQTIEIQEKGHGNVQIDAHTLTAGAYSYTLMVDGKQVASKTMILTH